MKKRISFFVFVKNFNNGVLEQYDIMPTLYRRIYDNRGNISKDFYVYNEDFSKIPVKSKEMLNDFVNSELRYHFWSKCEYEFIVLDWPCRDTIEESRPIKVDVYNQVKPNLPIIVDLLWEEIKDKINY